MKMNKETQINELINKIVANSELVDIYTRELSNCMQKNQDLIHELAKLYAEATVELQKKINDN